MLMVRKIVLSIFAVLATAAMVVAQNRQVSGTVKDSAGQPIIGATVVVEGSTAGTTTGADGTFRLDAPVNSNLVVSFIGYESQTIALGYRTTVEVVLADDTQSIDDVVVVAYGTASKEAVTGSVTMVKSDVIEQRTTSNVTSALEGASAGVQVSSSYGEPGASTDILIRGFGSINGNNAPLYVVDGNIFAGNMSDINPADIESMSILKDAASAALYGSRAAQGVVLITTKKGKGDGKLNVNVSTKQGVYTRGLKEYDVLSADPWMEVMWNTLYSDYDMAYGGAYSDSMIRQWASEDLMEYVINNIYDADAASIIDPTTGKVQAKVKPGYTDLNWFDPVEKTGYRGEYNIQLDAAGKNYDVFASVNYLNEEGYVVNTGFERTTARVAANFTPKKWFKAGVNLSGSLQSQNYRATAYSSYSANPFYSARMMAPVYPYYEHDESGAIVYDDNGDPQYNFDTSYLSNRNIAYELRQDYDRNYRTTLNASTYATITFLKDFQFTVRGSIDRRHLTSKAYNNKNIGDGAANGGRLSKDFYEYNTVNLQQQLSYAKTFGKHSVDAMVGHENYDYKYNYDFAMKNGELFQTGVFDTFQTMQYIDGNSTSYHSESYLARARYNFDERYFIEGSFRRDGSSRFAKESRWGNFWSIGGSWVASSEKFMEDAEWVDFLKLRASYGEVGNDSSAGYYEAQGLYSAGYGTNGGNGTIFLTQLANSALHWENSQSFDVGIDARLWNTVDFTLDYFNKRSKDLIFARKYAPSVGTLGPGDSYPSSVVNMGSVDNSGFEVAVNVDIFNKRDFKWSIGANASFVQNKIKSLPATSEEGNAYMSGNYRYQEGHSMYEFYLYKYQGVDQMTGQALYTFDDSEDNMKDIDNLMALGAVSEINGKYYATNTTYAKKDWSGEAMPDVYGGVNTNLSWKGLHFNVMASYSIGGKIYDGTYRALMYPYLSGPQALHADILNSWVAVPDGMTADSANRITKGIFPRNENTTNSYTYAHSDRWLVDASYFIIKNIGLSYDLPKKWANAIDLSNINISVNVENPFIFTKRDGLNPQYSFSGSQDQTYVAARIWTVGLNIKL